MIILNGIERQNFQTNVTKFTSVKIILNGIESYP